MAVVAAPPDCVGAGARERGGGGSSRGIGSSTATTTTRGGDEGWGGGSSGVATHRDGHCGRCAGGRGGRAGGWVCAAVAGNEELWSLRVDDVDVCAVDGVADESLLVLFLFYFTKRKAWT